MHIEDALAIVAAQHPVPLAIPIEGSPLDLAATACAVTKGRLKLRSPIKEYPMLGKLKLLDPPHLTVYEAAWWSFAVDTLTPREARALVRIGGNTVWENRLFGSDFIEHQAERPDSLTVSASTIRQLATSVEAMGIGRRLADLVYDQAEVLFDDIPIELVPACDRPRAKLLQPASFTGWEQANIATRSFLIRCSRACSHEFITHRKISRDQRSQRVVDEYADGIGFIWPPAVAERWALAAGTEERWSLEQYTHARAAGLKPQDARYFLPNATATVLIATAPLKWWADFLLKRGAHAAQEEIRMLAWQIAQAIPERHPLALPIDERGIEPWLDTVRQINPATASNT